MKTFYFFTDGASEPTNPGPSAFAFTELASYHDKREVDSFYKFIGHNTNNVAELKGIDAAFKHILTHKEHYLKEGNEIFVYSDSMYALDCIRKWYPNWVSKRKLDDKKNLDIIKPAYERYIEIKKVVPITLDWVKGHSGHWGNERADELCSKAIKEGSELNLHQEPLKRSHVDYMREYNEYIRSINLIYDELDDSIKKFIALHKSLFKTKIKKEEAIKIIKKELYAK